MFFGGEPLPFLVFSLIFRGLSYGLIVPHWEPVFPQSGLRTSRQHLEALQLQIRDHLNSYHNIMMIIAIRNAKNQAKILS